MNSFQVDYIKAKVLCDALYDRKYALMKDFQHLVGKRPPVKEDIDKYVDAEMEVERQLGIEYANRHFLEAQVNLFGWARRELERLDWKREGYHEVLALFERQLTPAQLDRLADICLRMKDPIADVEELEDRTAPESVGFFWYPTRHK